MKDFLSSGDVRGGSTVAVDGAAVAPEVASVEAPGRIVLASLSSAALTTNEMKTKQMGEAIAVSFMFRIDVRPCTGKRRKGANREGHSPHYS